MREQLSRPSALAMIGVALVVFVSSARSGQNPSPIVLGATAAQRHEAARALVPLLEHVKAHAQPGATVKPGTVPDSPFAGTQTTLFAFSVSKRSVPVDPRVVSAMNRLLAWNVGAPSQEENARLFDRWLIELEARSSAAGRLKGESGLCDVTCVVERMTTLNEAWSSSPRTRADVRDEMLLEALKVAVLTP
jgi:hypothetical protein